MVTYPTKMRLIVLALSISAFMLFNHSVVAQKAGQEEIRLIIRVDDLGASHSVNTGILKTIKDGIATSIEIMVPTPWYPEAIRMLQEMPNTDVGVHLTLTSEWSNVKWRPITSVPSLTDSSGYFYPMVRKNERIPNGAIMEHDWKLSDIEQELRAQIEMAKRDIPQVSHLSTHMGCLSINTETQDLLVKLAKEYDLEISMSKGELQRFPHLGDNTAPPEERVVKFIENLHQLTAGTWLFVEHPADDTPEQQAIGHVGYEHVAQDRYAVMKMLTDKRVKDAIETLGIKLISYADLK